MGKCECGRLKGNPCGPLRPNTINVTMPRENLGETLASIQMSSEKLERVTTPSCRALHFYSQGMAYANQRKWPQAEPLFRDALKEDPEFASAYTFLAWSIGNQGGSRDKVLHYRERGFELAEQVSYPERLFIHGTYYLGLGDPEKACSTFKTLADLYPDHNSWSVGNAANICGGSLGQRLEALPYWVAAAEARPQDFDVNANAFRRLAFVGKNWPQAKRYLERAKQVLENDPFARAHPDMQAEIKVGPSMELWQKGDVAGALGEVSQVAKTLHSLDDIRADPLKSFIGHFYLTLGQLDAARELFHDLSTPARLGRSEKSVRGKVSWHGNLAKLAFCAEDELNLRENLRSWSAEPPRISDHEIFLLMSQAGLVAEAQEVLSALTRVPRLAGNLLRGVLALAQGPPEEAIALLRVGVEFWRTSGLAQYFLGSEQLARVLKAEGDLAGALEVLEEASQERERVGPRAGPFWLRAAGSNLSKAGLPGKSSGSRSGTLRTPGLRRRRSPHPPPDPRTAAIGCRTYRRYLFF